jgi:hypothetical protein
MNTSTQNRFTSPLSAAAAALAALGVFALPVAAHAQTTVPSYATGGAPGEETIQGRVSAINGKYAISVRDKNGYIDNVTLHDGTIINPRGLTLAPGETVEIHGFAHGQEFVANEIDTPYLAYSPAFYGYPYYGYPYYGGIGIGFGFGFHGRFR